MSDNSSLLAHALDQATAIIEAIPDDRTHAATPCEEYDVTQLVAHVTVIAERVTIALDPTPADASRSWDQAYRRLRPLLDQAADAGTDRIVELPFGRMPIDAALGVFVGEFVTHSWDLAVSIGRTNLLDDSLGAQALAMVTARIPSEPRTPTPFGEVVPVSDDAPIYDRLAGWMGRDPAW
jgi:uncharacterized protein (TIGR03086 family)